MDLKKSYIFLFSTRFDAAIFATVCVSHICWPTKFIGSGRPAIANYFMRSNNRLDRILSWIFVVSPVLPLPIPLLLIVLACFSITGWTSYFLYFFEFILLTFGLFFAAAITTKFRFKQSWFFFLVKQRREKLRRKKKRRPTQMKRSKIK